MDLRPTVNSVSGLVQPAREACFDHEFSQGTCKQCRKDTKKEKILLCNRSPDYWMNLVATLWILGLGFNNKVHLSSYQKRH